MKNNMLKRIFAVMLAVAMTFSCITIVTAEETETPQVIRTTILDDKFEDYGTTTVTFNGQWADLTSGKTRPFGMDYTNAKPKWHANQFGTTTNVTMGNPTTTMKTVEESEGSTNKVLSIEGSSTGGHPIFVRLTGNANSSGKVTECYTLETEGKLIVSAKIKTTSASKFTHAVFAVTPGSAVSASGYVATASMSTENLYHALKVTDGYIVPGNFGCTAFRLEPDVWHTVKFVYDLSKTAANGTTPCDIYADDMTTPVATNIALSSSIPGPLTSLAGLSIVQAGNKTDAQYDDFIVRYFDAEAEDSGELTCNVTDGAFNVAGTSYNASLTLKNNTSESKNVWCAVAAYGANNRLLGLGLVPFDDAIAGGVTTDAQPFEITNIAQANVEKILLFVWNSSTEMNPYMEPVSVYKVAVD